MPVYLDHAATTPVFPHVARQVERQRLVVGNPSSLHAAGRAARRVVEESRERLAAVLGARPSEVVFTSGGTESDNLAIRGVFTAARDADPRRVRLLVGAVEHHAVLDCVEFLQAHEGAKVTWLEVDAGGSVRPETVAAALARDAGDVALVSVMWANNEVGTVSDVAGIVEVAHAAGVPVHSDAVQALGHVPLDFGSSGLDLMTVTAHKTGGPVGTGALVVRRDQALVPLSHGGGQERQIRSGTLDVAGILGFSLAAEYAVSRLDVEGERLVGLRDRLIQGAMDLGYGIRASGAWSPGDWSTRLPGNAHLLVPGCEGDALMYLLDAAGVECSTGSACQAGVPQPSHVLVAMGCSEREARGALRLTLGHTSTPTDVEAALEALPAAVERARRAAAIG